MAKRRRFTAGFKARVALEALSGINRQQTVLLFRFLLFVHITTRFDQKGFLEEPQFQADTL